MQNGSIVDTCNSDNILTVLYYNACSLFPKLDCLAASCLASSPDVFCIVESWLSPDIIDSEISIPGYSVTRLDRNRHGGGIVLYIKDSLPFKVNFLGTENLELIFVTIFPATVNQICLGEHCISTIPRDPTATVAAGAVLLVADPGSRIKLPKLTILEISLNGHRFGTFNNILG